MEFREREINLTAIEEEKKEALASRNAVRYYMCCNLLGAEPELQDLYDEGAARVESRRTKHASRSHRIFGAADFTQEGRYRGFVREAQRIGIMTPLGRDSERKARLLKKYFPRRFGVDGNQPVISYNSAEIGKIYRGVMKQARDSIGRKR